MANPGMPRPLESFEVIFVDPAERPSKQVCARINYPVGRLRRSWCLPERPKERGLERGVRTEGAVQEAASIEVCHSCNGIGFRICPKFGATLLTMPGQNASR